MDHALVWVSHYGYGAIFVLLLLGVVGLPIPDETLLIVCGSLILKGALKPVPAFCAAVAGSWCGITLSYTIGRVLGGAAVAHYGRRLHVTEQRLAQVHGWFNRIGHWALTFGYFIAGVRHLTAIVAGMSELEFRSFALYAWPGGFVWVLTFLVAGYTIGEDWRSIADLIQRRLGYASAAIVIAVVAILLIRAFLRRRRKPD